MSPDQSPVNMRDLNEKQLTARHLHRPKREHQFKAKRLASRDQRLRRIGEETLQHINRQQIDVQGAQSINKF